MRGASPGIVGSLSRLAPVLFVTDEMRLALLYLDSNTLVHSFHAELGTYHQDLTQAGL